MISLSAVLSPVAAGEPHQADGPVYTIDDLAAASGVPSRTIRFYQSKGALPKPEIRGRTAYYTPAHKERLELIARLQDRGLQIRAICELVQRIEKGDIQLDEWLGVEAQLQKPWSNDRPRLVTEAELNAMLPSDQPGLLANLVRLGTVTRQGDSYLIPSPALLKISLQLQSVGIPAELSKQATKLIRKHLDPMARELTELYISHLGEGWGRSLETEDVVRAVESLRPMGLEAVQVIFGHMVEAELRSWVEEGKLSKLKAKKK